MPLPFCSFHFTINLIESVGFNGENVHPLSFWCIGSVCSIQQLRLVKSLTFFYDHGSDPLLLLIGQVNTAVFQSKIIALLPVLVVVLYAFYLMCIARTTHLKALQNGIL